ncbi:hypothetical protein SAY86_006732 [Trapa natans]|uniref:Uncharacterized protein n=1 Tax=Trapa natans TaxID=22666 RepID=A0AAN7L7X0_TRANT|nr:hypothetical protein SAY86_006732 [Trapa natans]
MVHYHLHSSFLFRYIALFKFMSRMERTHLSSGRMYLFIMTHVLHTVRVSAEKQRIAEEVASMLKLKVELDTSSSESIQTVVAALHAGAEFAEIPLYQCVLVAGSQSGVGGAQQIGMSCVVLRSSLISRAEFPSAKAIMDGFGGADLTISRLRHIL